ncbi:MAG: type I DNA topoisomerase [Thermoanaerobaculia bacterium]
MAKNLIIVESPTKTKTLKKFLGRNYAVEASVGHIRDLEKKDLGLGDNYEPRYRILPKKQDVVKKLRAQAKKAEVVYLAPDPDREGEAIAWHIAQVLDKDDGAIRRVTFNEITKSAVLHALEQPGEINQNLVEAQQARRILDRLMGFKLSPLLWDKVKRGLSAGRVQSVALKMVCERQAEIDAFDPVEYWVISADLEGSEPPAFTAKLHKIDSNKAEVGHGDDAAKIVSELEAGEFKVAEIVRRESKQRPAPPFITSRLQQEASRRFGFSARRTMGIAQGLYEGKEIGGRGAVGLITYMRTDSTRVADEAIAAARDFVTASYGADKLPDKPTVFKSKKGAQDAHEAIRPTTFDLPPKEVAKYLKAEDLKLYELIWNRFIASQMKPAVFDLTRVDIANGPYILRANGKVMKDPGFLSVYQEVRGAAYRAEEQPEGMLPTVKEGEVLKLKKVTPEQKFTKPPARYSEATLIKALEENGIGRPSTYASILATLRDREYVERIERRFRPSELGKVVNRLLQTGFADIINEGYTAQLEEKLDRIEEGELEWRTALVEFDDKFTKDLETADEKMPNIKREGIPTDEKCPECGSPLVMRFGRYGGFFGCTGYPECKYTRDIEIQEGEEAAAKEGEEEIKPCEKCGKPMALKRSRYGTFYGCTGYPDCKNIRKTGPAAAPPKSTGVACPKCKEGEIQEKRSRRGKTFYSCSRYPKCEFALWKPPVEKKCPDCGFPLLVEKVTRRKGIQHVCHKKDCSYEEDVAPPGE